MEIKQQIELTSKEDAQLPPHVQPSPSEAHHHLPATRPLSQQHVYPYWCASSSTFLAHPCTLAADGHCPPFQFCCFLAWYSFKKMLFSSYSPNPALGTNHYKNASKQQGCLWLYRSINKNTNLSSPHCFVRLPSLLFFYQQHSATSQKIPPAHTMRIQSAIPSSKFF